MWAEESLLYGRSVIYKYLIAKHLLFVLCEDERHIRVGNGNPGELVLGATCDAEGTKYAKQGT